MTAPRAGRGRLGWPMAAHRTRQRPTKISFLARTEKWVGPRAQGPLPSEFFITARHQAVCVSMAIRYSRTSLVSPNRGSTAVSTRRHNLPNRHRSRVALEHDTAPRLALEHSHRSDWDHHRRHPDDRRRHALLREGWTLVNCDVGVGPGGGSVGPGGGSVGRAAERGSASSSSALAAAVGRRRRWRRRTTTLTSLLTFSGSSPYRPPTSTRNFFAQF